MTSIFDRDLPRTEANFAPFSPLSFIERTAEVYPNRLAVVHGHLRQTWGETLPREDDDDAAARPARGGDGVSPLIITSNDLASAWAVDRLGQPGARRVWAYRVGGSAGSTRPHPCR